MTESTARRPSLAQIHEMTRRSEIFYVPATSRGASHGRTGSATEKHDPRSSLVRKKISKS